MQISKKIIYLRPGEIRRVKCGRCRPKHTSTFHIRKGELLVILCGSPWHRFAFACGFPRRIRLAIVRPSHVIEVKCKHH